MRIAEQLHDLPRVLLLTGYPPEGGGGGGVILRNLLDGFPADRLIWLATQADVSAKWVWRPDIRRRSVTRRIPGRRFGFIQMLWEGGLHAWEGMDALSLAKDINREWWPQALWVVLDYQNLWAAYEIVTTLKVPWHVSVHDDPETARRLVGSRLPSGWQRKFDYLYANAVSRDCVSRGMVQMYRDRYNVEAFQLCRTINPAKLEEARRCPILHRETIEIIMGGWGDCPVPWPGNLITALTLVSRQAGRKVCLNAFDPALKPFEGDMVKVHPRMPEVEFDKLLGQMDLGYAPDPLTENAQRFAQTSLSTKLVTCIGATLPCLYHGPSQSSAAEMFSRFNAGEIVDSQNPEDIATGFMKLIDSSDKYRDNAVKLAKSDFNPYEQTALLYRRFQHTAAEL